MPTYAINTRQTSAAALFMGCAPKTKFGTQDQDHAADGRAKWDAQVAVTYLAEPGQRVQAEVINVTVVSDQDPAAALTPGLPVELVDLRLGVSSPQTRDNGQGVRGGKPYWMASAVRQLTAARPADKAA